MKNRVFVKLKIDPTNNKPAAQIQQCPLTNTTIAKSNNRVILTTQLNSTPSLTSI